MKAQTINVITQTDEMIAVFEPAVTFHKKNTKLNHTQGHYVILKNILNCYLTKKLTILYALYPPLGGVGITDTRSNRVARVRIQACHSHIIISLHQAELLRSAHRQYCRPIVTCCSQRS